MNKKGVTLIELIVVFVIIAIAAGLIAPNISRWLPRYRLRSATRDIVSTMREAHMKAVTNRMEYQVDFVNRGLNSYILRYDSGGLKDGGPLCTAPSGITIDVANFPIGIARFNPDSTCVNGGTIILTYQKGGVTQAQRRIVLSAATGRVIIAE